MSTQGPGALQLGLGWLLGVRKTQPPAFPRPGPEMAPPSLLVIRICLGVSSCPSLALFSCLQVERLQEVGAEGCVGARQAEKSREDVLGSSSPSGGAVPRERTVLGRVPRLRPWVSGSHQGRQVRRRRMGGTVSSDIPVGAGSEPCGCPGLYLLLCLTDETDEVEWGWVCLRPRRLPRVPAM